MNTQPTLQICETCWERGTHDDDCAAKPAPEKHWYLVNWSAPEIGRVGMAEVGLPKPWRVGSAKEVSEWLAGQNGLKTEPMITSVFPMRPAE